MTVFCLIPGYSRRGESQRDMATACHDDQSRPSLEVNYDFFTPVDEGKRERERERNLTWSQRDVSVGKGAGRVCVCVCACVRASVRASVRACVVYHVGAPNLRCFGGNDGRYMVHRQRKCLTGTHYFS